MSHDSIYKILVIGDLGVGKTSLMNRFVDDTYTESYIGNIGLDFKMKAIDLNGKTVHLRIWDTAGQERFRTLAKSYYKDTKGIIVVYDITNKTSFDNVKHWLEEIERCADKNVKVLLVGNKWDLITEVSCDVAQKFADDIGISFFQTSAKAGINVKTIFHAIAAEILQSAEVTPLSLSEQEEEPKKTPPPDACLACERVKRPLSEQEERLKKKAAHVRRVNKRYHEKNIVSRYFLTDAFSLKDIMQSTLLVVAVKKDRPIGCGATAMYVDAENVTREFRRWLRGEYTDIHMPALIKKCCNVSTLEAIESACTDLSDYDWSRLVDLICLLEAEGVNISGVSTEMNIVYDDTVWEGNNEQLLSRTIEQLDVQDVMNLLYEHHADLVKALCGTVAYELCTALCASDKRLSQCDKFEFLPLDRLSADAERERKKFFL
jgi:Ras-related protein Rab-1A